MGLIRKFLVLSLLLLAILACSGSRFPAPTQTSVPEDSGLPQIVPEAYRALYASLEADLSTVEGFVHGLPAVPDPSTRIGTELVVASGNRGTDLLASQTMGAVELYLDRLVQLGVDGVSVQISDPLLTSEYPDSDDYLAFYQQVAAEIRRRGLVMMVETGPVFPDPQYSKVAFDWSTLSVQEYYDLRREQLVRIGREVRPDYLSIGSEPTTEVLLTGLDIDVQGYLGLVRGVIEDLEDLQGVLLGAGTGSWEDPVYIEAFLREPGLDFINIHIYPITNGRIDYVKRASQWSALAKAQGLQVAIGETWLYKVTAEELIQGIGYQEALQRDVFSFWQPLDIRHQRAIAQMALAQDIDFVSFFWSGFYYAYLEADPSLLGPSAVERYQELNRLQYANLLAGTLTDTGIDFQELLSVR